MSTALRRALVEPKHLDQALEAEIILRRLDSRVQLWVRDGRESSDPDFRPWCDCRGAARVLRVTLRVRRPDMCVLLCGDGAPSDDLKRREERRGVTAISDGVDDLREIVTKHVLKFAEKFAKGASVGLICGLRACCSCVCVHALRLLVVGVGCPARVAEGRAVTHARARWRGRRRRR